MMLFVFDVHLSDKPPASRKAGYKTQILRKLREIASFATDEKIDVIGFAGDWFISKKPEANSYELVAQASDAFAMCPSTLVSAIGNHDCESMESFKSSPAYLMFQAMPCKFDTRSGLVWAGFDYEIVTVNFDKAVDAATIRTISDESFDKSRIKNRRVLLVHGPIVPKHLWGQYHPNYQEKFIDPADLVGCADVVFYGDIHDNHGQYQIGETLFCNYGALCRNSAKELQNPRDITVATYDHKSNVITPVFLEDVDPIEDVFKVEEIEHAKELEENAQLFVDALDPNSLTFVTLTPEIMKERITNDNLLLSAEKQLGLKIVDATA